MDTEDRTKIFCFLAWHFAQNEGKKEKNKESQTACHMAWKRLVQPFHLQLE